MGLPDGDDVADDPEVDVTLGVLSSLPPLSTNHIPCGSTRGGSGVVVVVVVGWGLPLLGETPRVGEPVGVSLIDGLVPRSKYPRWGFFVRRRLMIGTGVSSRAPSGNEGEGDRWTGLASQESMTRGDPRVACESSKTACLPMRFGNCGSAFGYVTLREWLLFVGVADIGGDRCQGLFHDAAKS